MGTRLREQLPRKGRAVLVNHGSFNPVHHGHIRMMEKAKRRWVWVKIIPSGDRRILSLFPFPGFRFGVTLFLTTTPRLEAEGYEVIAGVMGITWQGWIHGKGASALDDKVRVELIDQLAHEAGNDWLYGELGGNQFNSYSAMTKGLLVPRYPKATFFGVFGGDFARGRFRRGPCVCVGRKGAELPEEDAADHFAEEMDEDVGDFSSTRVREALLRQDAPELIRLVGATAAETLQALPAEAWRSPMAEWEEDVSWKASQPQRRRRWG